MLIEERQPIESIGESNIAQARGTVKGLRRPESGSVVTTHDELLHQKMAYMPNFYKKKALMLKPKLTKQ